MAGRECRDGKLCLEWVTFEVLVGPLSGQKWGLESRVWET